MPSLPITPVIPRVQYTAAAGQTVFNIPYIFFLLTDITVYYTPAGTAPNDATQLIFQPVNYTVQQNPVTFVGTITLAVPANVNDIVTIVRAMPYQRLNFYIPGFGNFTPDAANTDNESQVLMIQQEIMFNQTVTPRYNLSAGPVVPNDTILPILGANQFWTKDPTNTFITAGILPSGSGVIIVPTTTNALAYFVNTTGTIASSPIINTAGALTGIVSATIGNLHISGNILSPTNVNGQIVISTLASGNGAIFIQSLAGIGLTDTAIINGHTLSINNAANTFGNTFSTQAGQAVSVNYSLPLTAPTAAYGLFTSTTAGALSWTNLATDGQVIIGSTAGAPVATTLTAGPGIAIANAANSITISAVGAGFAWQTVTAATQNLAVENGYVSNRGGGVTYTLPATANVGDEIEIVELNGVITIAQNAGQQIFIQNGATTIGVAGSIVSNNLGEAITLVCVIAGANTGWRGHPITGNWNVN